MNNVMIVYAENKKRMEYFMINTVLAVLVMRSNEVL